jgi:hypothetical protein
MQIERVVHRALAAVLSCAVIGCTGELPEVDQTEEAVVINPGDTRGWVDVTAPAGTLPDWAPSPSPSWGPSNTLRYDNRTYHIFNGTTEVAANPIGTKAFIAKGTYTLAFNDTKQTITVDTGKTTTVSLGRLEVRDVAGTWLVTAAAGDFTNGSQLFDAGAIPTGSGFFVLPGSYTVSVAYQAHTKTFPTTVVAGGNAIVSPDELRGWVRLVGPSGAGLPDWAPSPPPA